MSHQLNTYLYIHKFLYQYNANINFKNSALTFRKYNNGKKNNNNDIVLQTHNIYNCDNVHNLKKT